MKPLLFLVLFAGCLSTPTIASDSDTSDETDGQLEADVSMDGSFVDEAGPTVRWTTPSFEMRLRVNVNAAELVMDVPVYVEFTASLGETIKVIGPNGNLWPSELSSDRRSVWVRAPKVDSQAYFYIYYNPLIGEVDGDAPEMWDDYHFVYHMDDDASNAAPFERNETSSVVDYETGQFGQAAQLRINENITMPAFDDGFVNPEKAMTIDLWIKPADLTSNDGKSVIYMREDDHGPSIEYEAQEKTLTVEYEINDVPAIEARVEFENQVENEWVYIGAVIDRLNNEVRVHRNGGVGFTQSFDSDVDNSHESVFWIGSNDNDPFDGLVDEVRTQPVSRTRAWFAFQYRLGTDPTLISVDPPEARVIE